MGRTGRSGHGRTGDNRRLRQPIRGGPKSPGASWVRSPGARGYRSPSDTDGGPLIDVPADRLTREQLRFLTAARRATLATTTPLGAARLIPVCFVVVGEPALVYTPLDRKPKRSEDPLALARVRDIAERPEVTMLVDRWDEDWTRLAWLRLHGVAELVDAVPDDVVAALEEKHQQYRTHDLGTRPMIRIRPTRAVDWGDLG